MKPEVRMARQDSGIPVLWFLSGAAVGGVLALLFAPEAGRHTRRRLATQAKRGTRSLSSSGREVYEKGREVYDRGREIAEEAAEMFERGRKLAEKRIDDVI
jgi:gas vesicle protein